MVKLSELVGDREVSLQELCDIVVSNLPKEKLIIQIDDKYGDKETVNAIRRAIAKDCRHPYYTQIVRGVYKSSPRRVTIWEDYLHTIIRKKPVTQAERSRAIKELREQEYWEKHNATLAKIAKKEAFEQQIIDEINERNKNKLRNKH